MLGLGDKKCGCGASVPSNAKFCASCGKPVAGKPVTCASCGASVPRGKFCSQCGASVSAATPAVIEQRRWKRRPGELATRVDVSDLPGLLRSGLIVEAGTRALFLEDGVHRGTLAPGHYEWSALGASLVDRPFLSWLQGRAKHATVILVDAGDVELPVSVDGVRTADKVPLSVKGTLTLRISEPAALHENLLKDAAVVTAQDVNRWLDGEMADALRDALSQRTLEQLSAALSFKRDVETDVEAHVARSLERTGFRLVSLRTLSWGNEAIDRLLDRRGQHALDEADASQDIGHADREQDLTERRNQVLSRWRDLVLSDRFDEMQSRSELETELLHHDKDRIVRDTERAELVASFQIGQKSREHVLARLDQLNRQELDAGEQDHDLAKRAKERSFARDHGLKDADAAVEAKRLERAEKLEAWEKFRRIQAERDAAEKHSDQDIEDRKAAREREQLVARSQASAEALIAQSRTESEAKVLADLARTRTLSGLNPDTILAMAAEKSPEVAKAFQEKFSHSQFDEMKKLYERMMSETKDNASQNQKALLELMSTALQTNRDVGMAGAASRPPFSMSTATVSVPPRDAALAECLHCRARQVPGNRFCENCGQPLHG